MIVGDGRPLRFLAFIGGGWVVMRVLILWHATGSLPEAVREVLPLPRQAIAAVAPPIVRPARVDTLTRHPAWARIGMTTPLAAVSVQKAVDPVRVQLAMLAMTRFDSVLPGEAAPAVGDAPVQRATAQTPFTGIERMSRLSVSSWMIARGGVGIGASGLSPQLGGTQGGVRVDYALGHGIAATGRLAAPAAGAGREMSVGIAWRPAGVPLRLVAEQRVALDGGRSGPALGVSGGVSELRLPAGFRLESYGQAGAILRDGVEHYLDGSIRAARAVGEVAGLTLDVGGGAWGGAQRGVARVDVGPSVGARVPLAGRSMRLSLDWRQRIAGNARPGSGPALTLGTDF